MPHIRKRYLKKSLIKALKHASIVGIVGQRQTGKTTLVEDSVEEYVTLDSRRELSLVESEPEGFIKNRKKPFGIDECQLAPPLFPALKEHVRVNKAKGQFVLTGSVRFTSRKAIRESLTGRIFNLELLPMSISECHEEDLSGFACNFLRGKKPDFSVFSRKKDQEKRFVRFMNAGGLPGICFHRDPSIRKVSFESHIETLLDRDLRQVVNTTLPYRSLRLLLEVLAAFQGEPLDYTKLSRMTQISALTVKRIINAFESIFLVRSLNTRGGMRAPVLYMEDQGLASHLGARNYSKVDSFELKDIERGLFQQLYSQFYYRFELNPEFFQYRTRGGALVPISIKTESGYLGIIPCYFEEPTPAAMGSAGSFMDHYEGAKAIIACNGNGYRVWRENLISIPFFWLI